MLRPEIRIFLALGCPRINRRLLSEGHGCERFGVLPRSARLVSTQHRRDMDGTEVLCHGADLLPLAASSILQKGDICTVLEIPSKVLVSPFLRMFASRPLRAYCEVRAHLPPASSAPRPTRMASTAVSEMRPYPARCESGAAAPAT
jgi:hypothetical protein